MVVDTMVFVYALLGVEPHRDEAVAMLAKARTIVVPDSFRAEFANVLWQWVRHREVNRDLATALLQDTESLVTQVIDSNILWERALDLAVDNNHPVYDTLFVAAAEGLATRVITFDRRLARVFPDHVSTARAFLEPDA